MVELVRSGRTPEALAREFEPTAQSIADWVRQAERDAGKRSDGPTSAVREELIRLRRENHRLRQERDILSGSSKARRVNDHGCKLNAVCGPFAVARPDEFRRGERW